MASIQMIRSAVDFPMGVKNISLRNSLVPIRKELRRVLTGDLQQLFCVRIASRNEPSAYTKKPFLSTASLSIVSSLARCHPQVIG